ncbi:MAG TPA: spore gernimation protein GerD [Bacillus bacterium]|uniref:Spore germination protein GerD n=1 Tax=Siminovitchia fordii TaxID=254759 RepID=A0ABQ4K4G8_9BACI|nr:spore germination lipoprotein GerD [Siminovitchia fordii]GIN20611.1 spore germination protein GerD [Siminovitchia fordii]HBZ10810.1 spore gernimation protein GerD [Bacillus sp. (in: firmicutes)]
MKKGILLLLLVCSLLIAACGGKDLDAVQPDYDQTKKMMVDILKTDEGKKAVKDVLADEEIKQQLVMDQAAVRDTVEKTLTSEKGQEFWKNSLEDPKFAESMAKSMKEQNEELLKALMKDPEYQGMVMDILKDPAFQKDLSQALKSKEFREQMREVVTDTLESPLYKAKLEEMAKKAASEKKGDKGGGDEKK